MEIQQKGSLVESDLSSDSENETNWKKKSERKETIKKQKKAHELWTENLIEQTLEEGFGQCRVKKPRDVINRGSETYDFKTKAFERGDSGEEEDETTAKMDFGYDYDQKTKSEDDDLEEFGVSKETRKIKPPKVKERLGDKKDYTNHSLQKVAEKIVQKLKEEKPELIQRCVQFLGAKKSIQLLNMTMDIEETGGMTTKDGTRRRTPGGVYLQLLKNDPNVRKDVMDKIFQESRLEQYKAKKAYRKMKRKQATKKAAASGIQVKPLPTITDLVLKGADKSENQCPPDIEDGEIMD